MQTLWGLYPSALSIEVCTPSYVTASLPSSVSIRDRSILHFGDVLMQLKTEGALCRSQVATDFRSLYLPSLSKALSPTNTALYFSVLRGQTPGTFLHQWLQVISGKCCFMQLPDLPLLYQRILLLVGRCWVFLVCVSVSIIIAFCQVCWYTLLVHVRQGQADFYEFRAGLLYIVSSVLDGCIARLFKMQIHSLSWTPSKWFYLRVSLSSDLVNDLVVLNNAWILRSFLYKFKTC